ncbi:ABC transporter permease subunit [Nocardioides sp. zg-536]|uniref:ABC transporter permease subunit n=1 Tax=Nocardioides faecalis TaxID=2803858 RepID=A0A938Y7F5_9ACTN|nr:ABC transporter permease subunit [Nocardioides faecalis]MBM9459578.1 ABC transporter permease subunit [Nocardioides faecalis]MBS4753642.1 ABC transporter permease subunit [Nocardioides faecalis]QVI58105.1 ABC transporter permease subunit [Nocardioides faecalis]
MSRTIGRSLLTALLTIAIVLALWQAVVSLAGVSPYVAKGPLDVFRYLFVDEPGAEPGRLAADHRAALWPLAEQTLRDSALGFVVGMSVAVLLAVLFSLSKTVEAGVMPLALLLRSVPLVSISPVIILITGRGSSTSVAVIGSIVVLFPALASALFGLSRASKESLDLVRVYGGSNATALRKVSIPGALPSLFAAARVSVPGAVTGALLAEWLSTGQGIGGSIQKFSAAAKFNDLWASVAIITAITLVLYNLVQVLENAVLARMGMSQQQR